MSAHVIADATIDNMEKHRANFLPAVDELIARMGAKILARTGSPIHLGYGGGWQNGRRIILLEFPNADKAKEWFEELQYLPDPDNMIRHSTIIIEGIQT
jgi:uncharacterized protein (DUF1330 family)